VDAADPACAQETDPRRPADGERSADGRRADDALDGSRGEVARPDLPSVGVEPLRIPVEPIGRTYSVPCSDSVILREEGICAAVGAISSCNNDPPRSEIGYAPAQPKGKYVRPLSNVFTASKRDLM